MEQESKLIENTVQPECKPDAEPRPDGEENKYSSVVVKPTKSNNKMSALSRIKAIQENDWKTWKGPLVKHCGRPGTAGITKSRARKEPDILEEQDNLRLKNILKVILKMQQIDEDGICYSTELPGKDEKNTSKCSNSTAKPYKDSLNFKCPKETQMVTSSASGPSYAKSYHCDQTELLYKLLKCDAKLVRSVLEVSGFRSTDSHDWNVLWMNSSLNSYVYEGLNEHQKINHFPCSYEITRKDNLCTNVVDMQEKYGYAAFNIIPDTYVMPDEYSDFSVHFNELNREAPYKNLWIAKPSASCQGKGIYITDDIHDIDRTEECVVSRYIHNPLLINSHKFDLRIYVLITSFEPMRLYVYQEGLTRFASEPYSSGAKFNKFSHLTNYSINKKNNNFVQNQDLEHDDFGFKWSLSALCGHLEQIGIDMDLLWSKIYDLIIKSIIAAEDKIQAGLNKFCTHRTNCFEILGFDVLIDSELKPWLLEANMSPSLACDSPLDFKIKSNLVTDAFNLVGIK